MADKIEGKRILDGVPSSPGEFKVSAEAAVCHRSESMRRIMFACPCGCGDVLGIIVGAEEQKVPPVWKWDGDTDKPTVTPSIEYLSGCRWHGYLTAGVFETING